MLGGRWLTARRSGGSMLGGRWLNARRSGGSLLEGRWLNGRAPDCKAVVPGTNPAFPQPMANYDNP
jgi:hypothetical protein